MPDHIQLLKDLDEQLRSYEYLPQSLQQEQKGVSKGTYPNAGRAHPEQQKNETRYPFAHRPRTGFFETCVASFNPILTRTCLAAGGIRVRSTDEDLHAEPFGTSLVVLLNGHTSAQPFAFHAFAQFVGTVFALVRHSLKDEVVFGLIRRSGFRFGRRSGHGLSGWVRRLRFGLVGSRIGRWAASA